MPEGPSFHGSPAAGGGNERRVTALMVVLLAAFVAIAIVKPWGSPAEPAPAAAIPGASVRPPPPSIPTTAPELPSPAASARAVVHPIALAMPAPPASASWAGLDWRRLSPDDPLTLVASVLQWRRGYVAVGWLAAPPATPVWTSADGARWDALPFDTSSTFWPGMNVIGVTHLGAGLVALTEIVQWCSEPCPLVYILPVISWTSPDGRTWTPHVLPPEWLASPPGQAPLFATGPAGLVVATTGPASRLAASTDGSHWHLLPAGAFPARFALNDLRGTPTGYVALGRWTPAANGGEAASLWSADGRSWSATPTILPRASAGGADVGSAGTSLVLARDGMVAVGRGATTPGAALWWQSSDGRDWRALPAFSPLGPAACIGSGCSSKPNGALVGDGQRMVAVRGGADPAAWTSSDGLAWKRLRVTGDVPGELATHAVLLPGGVLLTDGTTTWFGEAQVP